MSPNAPLAHPPRSRRGRKPEGANPKTARLVLVITPAERERIVEAADRLGLSFSKLILRCVESALPELSA